MRLRRHIASLVGVERDDVVGDVEEGPGPTRDQDCRDPFSVSRGRMRSTNGVIGSCSAGMSCRIRSSRIMKFVAEVSSSINSALAPASSASTRLAPNALSGISGLRGSRARPWCEVTTAVGMRAGRAGQPG